jgi:CHAD domain-containing protein
MTRIMQRSPAGTIMPVELGTVVRSELTQTTSSFLANDRLLEAAITPEALHDARVDLRRVRSNLRTFRGLFDPDWLRGALSQISWYQTLLGDVRDVDVAIGNLLLLEECVNDRVGCAALTSLLAIDRAAAMRALEAGRSSARHAAAITALEELAADPPMRRRAVTEARDSLPPMLERAWRNLRESARVGRRDPTELALHGVRLRAKELRFSSELAATVLGDEARALAKACARVQRRLGRHRDAVAAEAWLLGAATVLPSAHGLASRVARAQRERAELLLEAWPGDMKRVKQAWRELDRSLH